MWTLNFWKDLFERAIKTAAQALIVAYGGNAFDFWALDWKAVLGVAASAAFTSVAMSLGSNFVGDSGTASLTNAVEPADDPGRHAKLDDSN